MLEESHGEFRTAIVASANNPLSATLQFSALDAAEMERRSAFDMEKLQAVECFGMREYLVTFAGPSPTDRLADAFYQRVTDLTDLQRRMSRARVVSLTVFTPG